MRNFLNLEIWKRSHQLTLKIYKITKSFPKEELFGLTGQMRRSSFINPYEYRRRLWQKFQSSTCKFSSNSYWFPF